MDGPQDQGNQAKKEKKPSSHLYPKLSDKSGSMLINKAPNTKHQYQDWIPKE
jgi:hypothetical protein